MSDVGLRLDGVLLMMVLAASAAVLAIVAGGLFALSFIAGGKWRRFRRNALMIGALSGIAVVAGFATFGYTEIVGLPASGPDVIDWLILPWLVFLIWAVARLEWRPTSAAIDQTSSTSRP